MSGSVGFYRVGGDKQHVRNRNPQSVAAGGLLVLWLSIISHGAPAKWSGTLLSDILPNKLLPINIKSSQFRAKGVLIKSRSEKNLFRSFSTRLNNERNDPHDRRQIMAQNNDRKICTSSDDEEYGAEFNNICQATTD